MTNTKPPHRRDDDMSERQLTRPQRKMLVDLAHGDARCPWGEGATARSAWTRTVRALRLRGLVSGDVRAPRVTAEGLRAVDQ